MATTATLDRSTSAPGAGDLWGALAATAILLPQAMAFGITALAPAGVDAATGAYAGLVTTAALCLTTGIIGGAQGVISAPTGPALVLVTSALAVLAQQGLAGTTLLLGLAVVVALAGVMQFLIGLSGGGRLIKYIPSPVISGFMTGAAILMILSQLKGIDGAGAGAAWTDWRWLPAAAAGVTILGVRALPRLLPQVPGPIAGLVVGTLVFHVLAGAHGGAVPGTWLVGKLAGFRADALGLPLHGIERLPWAAMLPAAAALAVLAAVNTLLAGVIADTITGQRHDSRRALMGQGAGLVLSSLVGGIAGSGTTAATVIAVKSGGGRWVAGAVAVLFLLLTAFGGDIGRVLPRGALAGVIIAVAIDVADRDILRWARRGRTRQDAMIALLVTVITVSYNLVAAVGVGVAIAILLFIREQIAAAVVHRRSTAREARSIRARGDAERALLDQYGDRIVLFELRGNLFFGTTDRLIDELEPFLHGPNWVILHLRRVTRVDLTALKLLQQVANRLHEHGGSLAVCELHEGIGIGESMEDALRMASGRQSDSPVMTYNGRDEALEYAENALLAALDFDTRDDNGNRQLADNAIARYLDAVQVAELEHVLEPRDIAAGAALFAAGDSGDELYVVMRGQIEIRLHTTSHHYKRLAVYGAGSFFGELALLSTGPRAAHAIAASDTRLLVLSRQLFEHIKVEHPDLAIALLTAICDTLVNNQRWSTRELQRLSEW